MTVKVNDLAHWALAAAAAAAILFVAFLTINHAGFPLNLDLMESTVLQHVRRAAAFRAIYPEPSPAYVPLAYNPLYYVLAVPFTWLLGVNLTTLRLVAILGMLGSGLLVYRIVRERTGSRWWGLIAAGLFAAAYRVMDTYLDNAHADSWLLFCALLGTYLIDRNRSRAWNLAGVVVLVSAFWFKQHGALFAIGGVLYLTWREGPRHAVPYWVAAALLGPVLYLVAGPWLFGPFFHYFTWEVPRRWSELSLYTFRRILYFCRTSYPFLALAGAVTTGAAGWAAARVGTRERRTFCVWRFQFIFAVLTGLMGSLDLGSADNVYIPMGTWFVLVGTLGLNDLAKRSDAARRYGFHLLLLAASFAVMVYDPRTVIVSPRSGASYADLIATLRGLKGSVYAPSLGQLPGGYRLYPAAHWVALEDMIRGPGREMPNHPITRRLLEPAAHPRGRAFILTNLPFREGWPWMEFLVERYALVTDFGDRFKPLRVLPKRFDHLWPRYLYRYSPPAILRTPRGAIAGR